MRELLITGFAAVADDSVVTRLDAKFRYRGYKRSKFLLLPQPFFALPIEGKFEMSLNFLGTLLLILPFILFFQSLSADKDGLVKLKNSIKEIYKAGNSKSPK